MKAELICLQLWQWHLLSSSFYHIGEYSSSVLSLNSWNLSMFVHIHLSLFSPIPQIRITLQRLGVYILCLLHTYQLTDLFQEFSKCNFHASGQEKFLAQLYKYLLKKAQVLWHNTGWIISQEVLRFRVQAKPVQADGFFPVSAFSPQAEHEKDIILMDHLKANTVTPAYTIYRNSQQKAFPSLNCGV